MHVLVNELSFERQADDVQGARRLVNDLVTVIRNLSHLRESDPIVSSQTLWDRQVCEGYTVHHLLNDIGRDQMIWFKHLVRKGPYIESILDNSLAYHECLFGQEDVTSTSLAGAIFLEGTLSSLQDTDRFSSEHISLKYREGDLPFNDYSVWNAFDPGNIDQLVRKISTDIIENLSSWNDFWERRSALFPELSFCECVKEQLQRLSFSVTNVKIIRRHLTAMDGYCKRIREEQAGFTPDYTAMGIRASGESPKTLARYGYQREFECPDGRVRLFSWHTKQYGKNLRIHFYPPDEETDILIIGYIGPHLDTIKFN